MAVTKQICRFHHVSVWRWSLGEQQLHESAHRVHPVENTKRLAQVHQDKPGGEAEELLPEAVLELRMDPEGGDDPELRDGRTAGQLSAPEGGKEGRRCGVTWSHHHVGQDEEGTDLFTGSLSPGPFPIMHLGSWRCGVVL